MQRLLTAALVLCAIGFSAGGVAVSVRADSSQAQQDRCEMAAHPAPVRMNAKAAQLAAQDDTKPLNTQGYNYNAYDDQWRPEIPAAAPNGPAVPPAAPAKR